MGADNFYAHTLEGDLSRENWQRLEDHLTGAGGLAKNFAAAFGAGKFAWIAGLLHDLGKYSAEFQDMLNAANAVDAHIEGEAKSHKKRVDHSTAGAQHAEKVFAHENMGRLLAYVIAGHHAGLPNGSDGEKGGSSLEARLSKKIPAIFPPDDFLQLLEHETLGLKDLPFTLDKKRFGFQVGFFIRMLYSALVDADFLDTEAFLDSEKALRREGYPTLEELEGPLFAELKRLGTEAKPTSVNRRRAEILQDCLAAAEEEPGLFSLTVRSLDLGLSGIADVVEFHQAGIDDPGGTVLPGSPGRWRPYPVEYKRGRKKAGNCDNVQLCAQAMCLEEMLDCQIHEAALFYGKTRRRTVVNLDDRLRTLTRQTALRLHRMIRSAETPPPQYSAKCDNCSLIEQCMPKQTSKTNAAAYVKKMLAAMLNNQPGKES